MTRIQRMIFQGAMAFLLGFTLTLGLMGCDEKKKFEYPKVPAATGWTFFSSRVPAGSTPESFDFPDTDGVHYAFKGAPKLVVGQTITMTFEITGNATFKASDPSDVGVPPRVRLLIERRGDDLTQEHYRWWSTGNENSIELKPGTHTLSVKITPELWSSVYGKKGTDVPNDFNAAIVDAMNIGFTFGGMFYGHGVQIVKGSGTAHFTLKSFTIQ